MDLQELKNIEYALLGALLSYPFAIEEVDTVLAEHHFSNDFGKDVFWAVRNLWLEGVGSHNDSISVHRYLLRNQRGGKSYLAEMAQATVSACATPSLQHYAHLIVEQAIKRAAHTKCLELAHEALEAHTDAFKILGKAESIGLELTSLIKEQERGTNDVVLSIFERFQKAKAGELEESVGLPWFNAKMQKLLGETMAGELLIIAARPGMGKTTFAMQEAMYLSQNGYNVAVFSLEMTADELLSRYLKPAGVSLMDFRHGKGDVREVEQKAELIAKTPPQILEERDLYSIRGRCKALHSRKPLDAIFIDHIGLVNVPEMTKATDATAAMGKKARDFKALAMELNIPVFLVSQLNRNVDMRPDKRPVLADLRQSGELEENANKVLFLYRESYYTAKAEGIDLCGDREIIEVDIAKNRNGATMAIGVEATLKDFVFHKDCKLSNF